jgi:hypothetical protein
VTFDDVAAIVRAVLSARHSANNPSSDIFGVHLMILEAVTVRVQAGQLSEAT